jgi:TonB family C-terminal domain
VAIKPAINHAPTLPKTRIENVPQSATPSVQPPDQTAKAETAVPFTQETPATSNLPEIANQGTMDGTDKPSDREQGTANSNAKPSSLNAFSDRIRNLLRGNSPNPVPSSPQTDPAPSTAEPNSPQRVQCIRCDKPQYPTAARNRGWQGQARLAVDVDANGNVTNVRLINSSGHLELDEAAIRQARQWKFTPSASGRQGIGVKVDFQLEGSEYQRQDKETADRRVS